MYMIIRLLIGCIFLVCAIAAIKKSKAICKRVLYLVFAGIAVVLVVVLAFLPFENLFVTFDSPQAAYAYYLPGKSDTALVVEGDACDFVVGQKNGTDTYLIVPKTAEGWKTGIGADMKRIAQTISDGIVLYVYQYKNTKDYFVTVLDTNGGESTVTDAYNAEFLALERDNDSLGKTFVTYYAHIAPPDAQYSVTVNGTEIVLENK